MFKGVHHGGSIVDKRGDPAVPAADVGEGMTPLVAAGSRLNGRARLGGRPGRTSQGG